MENKRILKQLTVCLFFSGLVFMLTACGGGGGSSSSGTAAGDSFPAVQGEWYDTSSVEFQQAIGTHETTAASRPYAFVTDRLVIYTPTTESFGAEQTAAVTDAALTNVMTRFSVTEEDFLDAFTQRGMGDLEYAGKVFVVETGSTWGGTMTGFFRLELPNVELVDSPINNTYKLISHEMAHALTYGYMSPEKDGFGFMQRWLSEGLAEYYSGGIAPLPSRNEAVDFLATSAMTPVAVSDWGTMISVIGEDSPYYPYYHAAVVYLLTPTSQGGAGNTTEDLKYFLQTPLLLGEGFDEHFERFFSRNGVPLSMNEFRANYDTWVVDVLN